LPIFSLFRPSIPFLESGTGQTDGETDDGHQRLMPPPYGARA